MTEGTRNDDRFWGAEDTSVEREAVLAIGTEAADGLGGLVLSVGKVVVDVKFAMFC